jgi:histidinol-phosphate/aromatic aminotransferase/cobyric acid decarboxylase-like protein
VATDSEEELLALLRRLPQEQVEQLIEYAEFLLERHGSVEEGLPAGELPSPEDIPRPAQESVIQAIRRLTASYPMLQRRALLDETSMLMTQHILGGRGAVEIIDELELLFRRHYDALAEGTQDSDD